MKRIGLIGKPPIVITLALLLLGSIVAPAKSAGTQIVTPPGYVQTQSKDGLVYGQPSQIATIRSGLTEICTRGQHVPGLGPAIADVLIQVDMYATAEGSCGNPELEAVLRYTNGAWKAQNCGWGGGAVADYGNDSYYSRLISSCHFPIDIAKQFAAIRSQVPWAAQLDKSEAAFEETCKKNPQSNIGCPGYPLTPAQRHVVNYNRYFQAMEDAVRRGDFEDALSYAQLAKAIQPEVGLQDRTVAVLRSLVAKLKAGQITTAQAKAEWRQLGFL